MHMYVFAFNAIQRWISLVFMALAVHEVEPDIFTIIPSMMSYTKHFQLPVSPLAWNHRDATVPDNMVPSYRSASVEGPGSVAAYAEGSKESRYQSIQQSYIFIPTAIESFGAFGQKFMNFVKELGRRIILLW